MRATPTDDPALSVVRLETDALPMGQRFEVWRAYASAAGFDALATEKTARDPSVAMTSWFLDTVVLSDLNYGPHRISRKIRPRDRLNIGFLAIRYYREGEAIGLLEDQPIRARAGTIRISDNALDYGALTERMRQTSLFVPYDLVGYDPSRDPADRMLPTQSGPGRILADAIDALVAGVPHVRAVEASGLAAGFGGLLRGLLTPTRRDETARQAFAASRRQAIYGYIDAHLLDAGLGPTQLCRVFNISRAGLYRIFGDHGGVHRYLTERRLDRAFIEIAGQHYTRGHIGRVAGRLGFDDTALFSRQFRQRFDATASEIAGIGAAEPATCEADPRFGATRFGQIAPIRDWFSQISA